MHVVNIVNIGPKSRYLQGKHEHSYGKYWQKINASF